MNDKRTLRPRPEQYDEFVEHVCEAHSWYKHLPLLDGARFVFFVARDAGVGRLIPVTEDSAEDGPLIVKLLPAPDGGEFTGENPRPHYSWNTTNEYRSRFGHLDYMARVLPNGRYSRDVGPVISVDKTVEERCSVILYPYVHRKFVSSVTWPHYEPVLELLPSRADHPNWCELMELSRLVGSDQINCDKIRAITDDLRERERDKMRKALQALDDWLVYSG